ncbi:MAG: energy-coupling factor transporter transmembrane protein EcfT [Oscillospiraceae bacterium]|nr:energy-coupling factor transporter transmembrane protein EcfT [Oscillospiraceae bacterium]
MGFESYHPAINLFYFVSTIAAAILFKQPVFLLISYLSAFAYSVKRNGKRAVIFNLCLIPLIVIFAMYYSSYNHFGVTVMRQNFIGNNMTVESLLYGVTLGMIVATVFMWLSCVFSVFTADKVVYLFGRVSPKLSLFLSIILRTVPRLKAQAKKISTARRAVGRGVNQGNVFQRIVNAVCIFSMLLTWLLESFTTSSDSMRSRGYALKGRTAFSIYRFDNRDRSLVISLFACLTVALMGYLLGQTVIWYDPKIVMNPITPISFVFYMGFAVLCLLPLIMELWTEFRFKKTRCQL